MVMTRSSKTCRPLVHHYVWRTDLSEQLTSHSTKPVVAVLAPPGYGKTTFISSYIASVPGHSIWYCVDDGDTDLASFFDYLSHAVREATPKRRKLIPCYQRENALNVRMFARHYFNAIYQRLDQPFYLVFDDIHECQSQQWADVMSVAINELPENCRIFLIGRQGLPPEFARLNVHQKIHTIGEQDLRFNDEELVKLAAIQNINSLSTDQCNKIQAVMAGWGAGLTLLFTRMKRWNEQTILELDTKQDLFKYFTNEVLRCIDDVAHDVLYRTCFLPDVSVEHAIQLSKNNAAGDILQTLYDQNYFIYRMSDSALVYRYHPLFKAFLIAQSQKTLSIEALHDVQKISVSLLENDGAIVAAASLLIDTNNWEQLTKMTLQYAPQLVTENRTQTLLKWLKHIPTTTLNNAGWLLYWRGVCTFAIQLQIARQDFINAFEQFKILSDATGQCLSIAGVIDSYMFERDDFSPLDPWIEQVEKLQPMFEQHAVPHAMNHLTLSMFEALFHRAPHHHSFSLWLDRINKIPMHELPPGLRIKKQLNIILHHIWQGDFRQAKLSHSLLEKQLQNCLEPVPSILWHLIHCAFLWTVDDSQRALSIAKDGLNLAKEYGLEKLLNVALITHATAAALMTHNTEEASQWLDTPVLKTAATGRTHLCLYHIMHAIYSFRNGATSDTFFHAQEALSCADASGLPFFQANAHFNLAQYFFVTDNIEKARHHNLTAKQIGDEMHSYFHQFQTLLFEAILNWSIDQHELALSTLTAALRLAKQYDLITGLWICEFELTQILVEAMRRDIESAVTRHIIDQRHLIPVDPPYDIAAWPWSIRIYTLGSFDIMINDQRFELPSRSRPKLFAFLQTLITFGGKPVREEVISETVWPDAEGDAAHQLFDTTLFRLRKLLGIPEAIINRGGKISLNNRICWLDTRALSVGVDKLAALVKVKHPSVDQVKKCYNQLQDYYGGDFLQTEADVPIITQHRQRLRSKWQGALYLMASYWLQQHNSKEAEDCLARLIKVNSLEEKAYRLLMDLHVSQGRFSQAAIVYESCKKALQAGLDVKPSLETERVFNKIRVPGVV